MIRPKEMTKISLIGPKTQLPTIVDKLHELGVLHIDDYVKEEDTLELGDPQAQADELSETLVKLRSVRSKLPDVEGTAREDDGDLQEHLDRLQTSITDIQEDLDDVQEQIDEKHAALDALQAIEQLGLDTTDFTNYSSINTYLGTVADYDFRSELPDGRSELYHDENLIALFIDADADIDDALRTSGFEPIDMTPVQNMTDPVKQMIGQVQGELQILESKADELTDELEEIAGEWRGYLTTQEYKLSSELEKAEAPLQFAVTDSTFIAEGWIPTEQYETVQEELTQLTDDRVYLEEIESEPNKTPMEHDNPRGVETFEDLVGFFGTPSYTEIDPTFLLLTFPLMFGFMLGDIGYGLTTFAVFYFMYRKYPSVEGLWKSLMYASVVTIIFGFIYGDMFGFVIFGHESVLTAVTGLQLFSHIPILFDRAHQLTTVFMISLAFGVFHVNLGYLLGAYNTYHNHGLIDAVLEHLSWIVIEIGAAIAYLAEAHIGAGVIILGVGMLYMGEGVEGVFELPTLLSNILSYLRIFGVAVAVIALGTVVNKFATPLFQSGNLLMIAGGILMLIVGHTINTFLKLMEVGLQGIRLHYVEFFTKFFHGGGKRYKPFGRKHRY